MEREESYLQPKSPLTPPNLPEEPSQTLARQGQFGLQPPSSQLLPFPSLSSYLPILFLGLQGTFSQQSARFPGVKGQSNN